MEELLRERRSTWCPGRACLGPRFLFPNGEARRGCGKAQLTRRGRKTLVTPGKEVNGEANKERFAPP